MSDPDKGSCAIFTDPRFRCIRVLLIRLITLKNGFLKLKQTSPFSLAKHAIPILHFYSTEVEFLTLVHPLPRLKPQIKFFCTETYQISARTCNIPILKKDQPRHPMLSKSPSSHSWADFWLDLMAPQTRKPPISFRVPVCGFSNMKCITLELLYSLFGMKESVSRT